MTRPHASAIVEDAWHRQLERGLRRRHWRNRVISYTGYGSTEHLRVFARVLLYPPQEQEPHHENRQDVTYGGLRSPYQQRRGWRSFFTAPAMGVPVEIRVGHHVAHGRSDRSGHVDVTFRGHGLAPGWHEVTIGAQRSEPVQASVVVVDPAQTYGIVSDIDDTVISTSLPRPMIAAWNTFVLHEGARRVVPGMAPLYRQIVQEHPDAPVIYLSTGAWNTAPTLARFLKGHGYPRGPLLLTDWGPTNTGWFRSGQDHKRAALERLARDFPQITWLLIGDDGQHDPKIYRDFAESRPESVDAILIRRLSAAEQVLSHGIPIPNEPIVGRSTRRPREVPVFSAPDGYQLMQRMRATGRIKSAAADPSTGAPADSTDEAGWRA
ncbi:MAG: phosphatase domain-containing protein [Dermatophilaceae bacterium]